MPLLVLLAQVIVLLVFLAALGVMFLFSLTRVFVLGVVEVFRALWD